MYKYAIPLVIVLIIGISVAIFDDDQEEYLVTLKYHFPKNTPDRQYVVLLTERWTSNEWLWYVNKSTYDTLKIVQWVELNKSQTNMEEFNRRNHE